MTASDFVVAPPRRGRELARFIVNLRVRGGSSREKARLKGWNRTDRQQNILNIFNCLRKITPKG
jgi:hypothetical protein